MLIDALGDRLIPDTHGRNTVMSLYLDTPDFLLIRNSITARTYKEKLRIRSYGTPNEDSLVFFEIKKKYKGVVYKRRIKLSLAKAMRYIADGTRPEDSQIMDEIDYAMRFYRGPSPKMLISYERDAFFVKDMPNLRLTFDSGIRYRTGDLFLENGSKGERIIGDDEYILEVKTDGAMPIWLAHALSELSILPSSFSKYGTAYQNNISKGIKEYEFV